MPLRVTIYLNDDFEIQIRKPIGVEVEVIESNPDYIGPGDDKAGPYIGDLYPAETEVDQLEIDEADLSEARDYLGIAQPE